MIDIWCEDCNREPWFNYAIGEYVCPECGKYIQCDDVSEEEYKERRDSEMIPIMGGNYRIPRSEYLSKRNPKAW